MLGYRLPFWRLRRFYWQHIATSRQIRRKRARESRSYRDRIEWREWAKKLFADEERK